MNSTLKLPCLISVAAVTDFRSSVVSARFWIVSFSSVRVISEFIDFCAVVFSCLIFVRTSWNSWNNFEGSEFSL